MTNREHYQIKFDKLGKLASQLNADYLMPNMQLRVIGHGCENEKRYIIESLFSLETILDGVVIHTTRGRGLSFGELEEQLVKQLINLASIQCVIKATGER